MPLDGLPLKLKGVPGTGNNSIVAEVMGRDWGGNAGLVQINNNTDFIGGGNPSLPTGMTEYASKTQSWGRMYSIHNSLAGSYVRTTETLEQYAIGTSLTLEFTFRQQQNTRCYADASQTAFIVGDAVAAEFWYRAKQTAGGWTSSNTWSPYTSQTWSVTHDTWDGQWDLDGCLVEGTKIWVRPDLCIPVEQVVVGMEIYTAHETTGKLGMYRVTKANKTPVKIYAQYKFDDGSMIRCSTGHRFMTPLGMRSRLKKGDEVYKYDKDWNKHIIKITEKHAFDTVLSVYKIEVDQAHTYISENGIFNHNAK